MNNSFRPTNQAFWFSKAIYAGFFSADGHKISVCIKATFQCSSPLLKSLCLFETLYRVLLAVVSNAIEKSHRHEKQVSEKCTYPGKEG